MSQKYSNLQPAGRPVWQVCLLLVSCLAAVAAAAQNPAPVIDASPDASHALSEGIAAYRDKNYSLAFEVLGPLAEAGQVRAQVTLGLMYEQGEGVARNVAQAVQWFERAAQNGNATLRHDLAVKYFKGEGIPQDYAAAAKWWKLSAADGLAQSQYDLGVLFYRGLGVEQSYSEAAALYSSAAAKAHPRAQYSLAVMHALGRGVSRDYAKAARWFARAADQGDALSQYNLGLLLENGWGVARDTDQALVWFERAAAQDLQQAHQRLVELRALSANAPREPRLAGAASLTLAKSVLPGASTDQPGEGNAAVRQEPPVAPRAAVTPARSAVRSAPVPAPVTAATSTSQGSLPPAPVTRSHPPAYTPSPAGSQYWVDQFDGAAYTLQLASLTDEPTAQRMLDKLGASTRGAGIAVYEAKGRTRYAVLSGVFQNKRQAEAAVSALPADFSRVKPWIRQMRELQAAAPR